MRPTAQISTGLTHQSMHLHRPVPPLKYWALLNAIRYIMRETPDPEYLLDALFEDTQYVADRDAGRKR